MKTHPVPKEFDGTKFMLRYKIAREDFWINGELLYVPDSLPPTLIFEVPDLPKDPVKTRLDKVSTIGELVEILKEEL